MDAMKSSKRFSSCHRIIDMPGSHCVPKTNSVPETTRHKLYNLIPVPAARRGRDWRVPCAGSAAWTAALYESGFAPRWYVPRADVGEPALTAVELTTFCPYKGGCSYYDIGTRRRAAWSYLNAWPEVAAVAGFISFEPDEVEVRLDGRRLRLEPGQNVVRHGVDRDLSLDEAPPDGQL